jgi:hypothetical protein
MHTRWTLVLCGVLYAASLGGCGVFKSSTSQASSESSSKVSSSCSPSGDEDSAYQRDIRDYTASYAMTGGTAERFQRDLGALAEEYGGTDWEADPTTLVAVGRGLGRVQVDEERTQELVAAVAHGDLRIRTTPQRHPARSPAGVGGRQLMRLKRVDPSCVDVSRPTVSAMCSLGSCWRVGAA